MKHIVIAIVIIMVCLASLAALNRGALSARTEGKVFSLAEEHMTVYAVKKSTDVYSLWQQRKVRGRVLLHLGRYLHFMEIPQSSDGPPQITAIVDDHAHFAIRRVSCKDFIRAAFQTDMVRKIYTVLPPVDFRTRFGDTAQQNEIAIHEFGSPRIFSTALPSVSEPVLLNIDASYFASMESARLADDLARSGLKADIITICLAEDNPDVTEADRRKARDFITLLSRHAAVSEYPAISPLAKDSR